MTPTRYHALLKVCDLACAQAAQTGADTRPDFFRNLAVALADDCPAQSHTAARIAASLEAADSARAELLTLLHT